MRVVVVSGACVCCCGDVPVHAEYNYLDHVCVLLWSVVHVCVVVVSGACVCVVVVSCVCICCSGQLWCMCCCGQRWTQCLCCSGQVPARAEYNYLDHVCVVVVSCGACVVVVSGDVCVVVVSGGHNVCVVVVRFRRMQSTTTWIMCVL